MKSHFLCVDLCTVLFPLNHTHSPHLLLVQVAVCLASWASMLTVMARIPLFSWAWLSILVLSSSSTTTSLTMRCRKMSIHPILMASSSTHPSKLVVAGRVFVKVSCKLLLQCLHCHAVRLSSWLWGCLFQHTGKAWSHLRTFFSAMFVFVGILHPWQAVSF